jgi:uncharacterized protein (TIGR00290 family)
MVATDVLLSWSGGKDSAMALYVLRQDPSLRIAHLLTTVTKDYGRVSIHGVRRALLARQAEALGINLFEVTIPAQCTHEAYQANMIAALTSPPLAGINTHAFGDLFLADVRRYRESNLAKLDKKPIFPVWGHDTGSLARKFIALGFRAVVVCVDRSVLPPEFAGRQFDKGFLEDLPDEIDPCGENGEFHTFVYDGPIFERPIDITLGESVVREGCVFQDLLPASRAVLAEEAL